jgi:hypothetical protein
LCIAAQKASFGKHRGIAWENILIRNAVGIDAAPGEPCDDCGEVSDKFNAGE